MAARAEPRRLPLGLAFVEGLDVHGSRFFHNYPPRWNGAPSRELLVIRRNHHTGAGKCETVRTLPIFPEATRKRRCIVPVDDFFAWKAIKGRRAK